MKIKLYNIIDDAVERGVRYGLNRAYKHVDNPDRDAITENVAREVMNALSEVIDFSDTDE